MNNEEFIKELKNLGIEISKDDITSFEIYKNLLQEYNKKFNLTSIIEDEEIYLKHFYDSLCLTKVKELKNSQSILDIGTGAGFPGLPLAILNKDKKITLVESNGKKTSFLNVVKDSLKLDNVEIINSRAEDFAKKHREEFDIVTSRAVSHLFVLSELELPTLKINGLFVPLKSNIDKEIEESNKHIEMLGGKIENIITYSLPLENSKRTIPCIRKVKTTNNKYPRDYSKITKDSKIFK